jgi:hypothetical protein
LIFPDFVGTSSIRVLQLLALCLMVVGFVGIAR